MLGGVRKLINAMGDDDQLMLYTTAGSTECVLPATSDKNLMYKTLGSIKQVEGSMDTARLISAVYSELQSDYQAVRMISSSMGLMVGMLMTRTFMPCRQGFQASSTPLGASTSPCWATLWPRLRVTDDGPDRLQRRTRHAQQVLPDRQVAHRAIRLCIFRRSAHDGRQRAAGVAHHRRAVRRADPLHQHRLAPDPVPAVCGVHRHLLLL